MVTPEEAIEEMKSYAKYSWGRLSESFEIAIEALEKQVLKKAWNDSDEAWCCPMCGCEVDLNDNYCFYCGQKLGGE